MATTRQPRRGSLQYWPRKRAARQYTKVRTWPKGEAGFLGFAGYKAGMTHIVVRDNNPNSRSKDEEIVVPVTVVECPAIKIFSIRFYKKTLKGLVAASEVVVAKDKELNRKVVLAKKAATLEKMKPEEFDDLRVLVYTQPKLTGIGKKMPEIFEMGIGGSDIKAKFEFAKGLVGKEIPITDVFKEGQQVDVKAVTRGKGFQGTTKRFGTKIRGRKTEKAKRGIGTLGPWHPAHILFSVPQAGKMGYHSRTEYNKCILKIGNKVEEINPRGGFLHYGLVKNPYILFFGSIAGPAKRIVRFNLPIRPNRRFMRDAPQIIYVSLASKQGA
ncbi:MAG: 50S ribosomal protein L3 [Candidatus Woesearchaeota archaeon]